MMINTYNLFISHSWSYGDAYDRLVKMLDDANYFYYKNYSVPKDDPIHNAPNSGALYNAIKNQMSPCHAVLILAGVYATYSDWINNEIKISKNEFYKSKPILAIQPWGSEKTSQVVKDNADLIVGWNTDSIIKGIRELA
jgi:hypothetical protein